MSAIKKIVLGVLGISVGVVAGLRYGGSVMRRLIRA